MIQRERELEGDEFKDKEAFVTQAYKDQMAELRRAEEEEKKKTGTFLFMNVCYTVCLLCYIEEEKKKNKGIGTGMAHFYRKLLDETEQKHEQTVAATSTTIVKGPQGPNLTITKPQEFQPKSDLELAQQAREAGKDVELNDDNQIVDKRELLTAGLNLAAPNTRHLMLQNSKNKNTSDEPVQVHTAVGTAASRREINERRAREVARQLEEENERLRKEKERQEQEALNRAVTKRNTEDSIQSARERYLARKKRKLEEGDAAGATGET